MRTNQVEQLLRSMATAGRVLARHGLMDFNQGQVSAREYGSELFWINRAEAGFDEFTAECFVQCHVSGQPDDSRLAPPELPLHRAIYERRKDVQAIVHTHGMYSILLGATDFEIRPISHEGAAFGGRTGRYTQSSCTILDIQAGRDVGSALGDKLAVLMRNHGALTVGTTIYEAVVLMLMFERACQIEWQARGSNLEVHSSSAEDVARKRQFNFSLASLRSLWLHACRSIDRDTA